MSNGTLNGEMWLATTVGLGAMASAVSERIALNPDAGHEGGHAQHHAHQYLQPEFAANQAAQGPGKVEKITGLKLFQAFQRRIHDELTRNTRVWIRAPAGPAAS